jgi:beta-lactamase class A
VPRLTRVRKKYRGVKTRLERVLFAAAAGALAGLVALLVYLPSLFDWGPGTDNGEPDGARPAGQTAASKQSPTSRQDRQVRRNWHPLALAIEEHFAAYPGRWAMVVVDLNTRERWEYNSADIFHPASTVKLAVGLYALHRFLEGKLDWEQTLIYQERDFEPGGGALEEAAFETEWPVGDLLYRALAHSNNIAVNMLGRHLGWWNIEQFTKEIGGPLTHGDDNLPQASAAIIASWWLHLSDLRARVPYDAVVLTDPLANADYRNRITAGLPPGTPHMHKYGSFEGSHHDSAVVLGPTPYAIIVMTEGMTWGEADTAIAEASRITWRYFTGR